MAKEWFKKEFTVGNLMSIGTMVILAVGAYFKFDYRITKCEDRELRLEQSYSEVDKTIRELAITSIRMGAAIDAIKEQRQSSPLFKGKIPN